jgi:hypothetical protein
MNKAHSDARCSTTQCKFFKNLVCTFNSIECLEPFPNIFNTYTCTERKLSQDTTNSDEELGYAKNANDPQKPEDASGKEIAAGRADPSQNKASPAGTSRTVLGDKNRSLAASQNSAATGTNKNPSQHTSQLGSARNTPGRSPAAADPRAKNGTGIANTNNSTASSRAAPPQHSTEGNVLHNDLVDIDELSAGQGLMRDFDRENGMPQSGGEAHDGSTGAQTATQIQAGTNPPDRSSGEFLCIVFVCMV